MMVCHCVVGKGTTTECDYLTASVIEAGSGKWTTTMRYAVDGKARQLGLDYNPL